MALVGREGSQDFLLTVRVRCGWRKERVVGGAGRPCKGLFLGSTPIAVEQYRGREQLFIGLFLFVSILSLCWARNGIVCPFWSVITIVDMSHAHPGCFGESDDEMQHRSCFPDVWLQQWYGMYMVSKKAVRDHGLLLDDGPFGSRSSQGTDRLATSLTWTKQMVWNRGS